MEGRERIPGGGEATWKGGLELIKGAPDELWARDPDMETVLGAMEGLFPQGSNVSLSLSLPPPLTLDPSELREGLKKKQEKWVTSSADFISGAADLHPLNLALQRPGRVPATQRVLPFHTYQAEYAGKGQVIIAAQPLPLFPTR